MSADVTALKRGKGGGGGGGGEFITVAQLRKRKLDVKRLDGLRLQQNVQEKALMHSGISHQEIYIFT